MGGAVYRLREDVQIMTEVDCHSCGYEWDYGGDLAFATCPSCRSKTEVEESET